jgi:tetratricopeptide (TPR) repeat protein
MSNNKYILYIFTINLQIGAILCTSCNDSIDENKRNLSLRDSTWLQAYETYQLEGDSFARHKLLIRTLKYAKYREDSIVTYRNLVNTAERLDSHEVALHYVSLWNRLDTSIEETFYCNYSRARILFYMGEFDSSLSYLLLAKSNQAFANKVFIEDSLLNLNESRIRDSISSMVAM